MKRLETFQEILEQRDPHLISLYMTTHRQMPDSAQNPIRFKNALAKLQDKIKGFENEKAIIELTEELYRDKELWTHTKEGLMLLIGKDAYYVGHLRKDPGEVILVGDYFHLIPYFKDRSLVEDGYILDLSKDRFELYHLEDYRLKPVELDTKKHFDELFDDNDPRVKLNKGGQGTADAGYHGLQDKADTDEKEKVKYFRYIDEELREKVLRDDLLILSGVKDNIVLFRELSKYGNIAPLALEKPLSSIDNGDLQDEIKALINPLHQEKKDAIYRSFGAAQGSDRLELHPDHIIKQVEQGRVERLLINEAKRNLKIEVLDQLVYDTMNAGGEIVVFSNHEDLPAVAALLRY